MTARGNEVLAQTDCNVSLAELAPYSSAQDGSCRTGAHAV
jgi:hypothetical protein